MILGFKRNGINYIVASALDRYHDNLLRGLLKNPTNYPIKKIEAIKGCMVAGMNGSYELEKLVDILENLNRDSLDYDILYNEVLPELRKAILNEKGIYKDNVFNTSLLVYYNHTYYSILESGLIDITKETVLSGSIIKRNIALEAIDKYRDLSARDTVIKIDSLLQRLNYFSLSPYFIYKDDGSGEIEVVEVRK